MYRCRLHVMSLKEQIQNELKEAMKAKNEVVLSVLRMLNSAIKNRELEKRAKLAKEGTEEKLEELSQLNDEEIVSVISSEAKKRKDAIEEFKKAGRRDLVEKEEKELEVLIKYMPEQMGEEEVRKIVNKAIEETGAASVKEMGKVMGVIMPQVKGKADGSLVQKIVKEELEK